MKMIMKTPAQIRTLRALRLIAPVTFCAGLALTITAWMEGDYTLFAIDLFLAILNAFFVYFEWCVLTLAPRR